MKMHFLALLATLCFATMNVMGQSAIVLPPIPSYATAFGLTHYVFFDDFRSLGTFDLAQSNPPGRNWYTANAPSYANSPFCQGSPCSASNPSWYSITNGSGVTVSSNQSNGQGAQNMSFGYLGTNSTVTGVAVSGANGFYVEGSAQFVIDPLAVQSCPDFWMQDIAGTVMQIQSSGSTRFGEIDIFEPISGNPKIQQGGHDWSNWDTSTQQKNTAGCPTGPCADYSTLDMTKFHRWGALMIPRSLNGGTGFVKFYLDGVQQGHGITWSANGDFGSIYQSDTFSINFAAGTNIPLSFKYIYVAQ